MGVPLLVGGNPRLVKEGPKVNLSEGEFEIVVEGHIDSIMFLHYEIKDKRENGTFEKPSTMQYKSGLKHIINGPCKMMIVITQPGTERHISVYAERLNDSIKSRSA